MPYGADIEEALTVSIGSVDSYDFHALDALQCMVERRKGGETGILSVSRMHSATRRGGQYIHTCTTAVVCTAVVSSRVPRCISR